MPTSNVQVQVDELRHPGGASEYYYYLGWGKDDTIQGDAMTYGELKELHSLIGKVLEEYKPKNK